MSSLCSREVASMSSSICAGQWLQNAELTEQDQRQCHGAAYHDLCLQERLCSINHGYESSKPTLYTRDTSDLCAAIMPYFPYSRQSKKKTHRGAITARMLANLMKVAGVDHVITIDLHAVQMQGFFKCPVDNLIAEPLLAKWIRQNIPRWTDAVVVSKNPGGTKRVTSLADALNLSFGIVTTDRRRPHTHANNSLQSSAIFESMGSDGTNDRQQLMDEAGLERAFTPERQTRSTDFAHRHVNGDLPYRGPNGRQRVITTMSPGIRTRLVNGNSDVPSSPLANSTRPESNASEDDNSANRGLPRSATALGVAQAQRDNDGYEDSEGDDDTDEVCCYRNNTD